MLHSSLSRVARGAVEFEHQVSLGHTVTTVDAQLLNAVVMVLTLGVVAGLAVLLVARRPSLRRSVSIKDSGPLSKTKKRGLRAWARRTKAAFAGTMLFVVLNGVLLIVTNPAPLWLGWLGLGAGIVIVVVGLAIHFSGRCPPLWLHHRFSECSLAPIPLREMQSAFPLVPLLSRRNGLAYRLQCKDCQPQQNHRDTILSPLHPIHQNQLRPVRTLPQTLPGPFLAGLILCSSTA